MATLLMTDPTQICEDILRADKAHNIEQAILPSENRIIDRLLARRLELVEAYEFTTPEDPKKKRKDKWLFTKKGEP